MSALVLIPRDTGKSKTKSGENMARRYKEARQLNKMMVAEAYEKLGISRATLNAWEGERKNPSIEALEAMADLYGVTTDYLLGRTSSSDEFPKQAISAQQLFTMNGKPVWSATYGWMLVHASSHSLLSSDGATIPFADSGELFVSPPPFANGIDLQLQPLPRADIRQRSEIWLEPISTDADLRNELRGWYTPKDLFVENEHGNRFSFDTYGSKWLAFFTEIGI